MSDDILLGLIQRLQDGESYDSVMDDVAKLEVSEDRRRLFIFSLNTVGTGMDPGEPVPPRSQPDLKLTIGSLEDEVWADSPRDRFDLNGRNRGPLNASAGSALSAIRDAVNGLFSQELSRRDLERKLFSIGDEVRSLLPELVLQMFDDKRLKRLDLQIASDLDFPIELCRVREEGFLCDHAEVSRWYTQGKGLFGKNAVAVQNVAFVEGVLEHGYEDEQSAILAVACDDGVHANVSDRDAVFREVFSTDDHHLLHYKGHIGKARTIETPDATRKIPPRLSMAKGESLDMSDIGALTKERVFFSNEPMFVLNGCDGSLPAEFIGGTTSFPDRLQELGVSAVVATNWQVSEAPATDFTTEFYAALKDGERIAAAVKFGREALLNKARELDQSGDEDGFCKYFLSAYAYVYYGPSDLKVSFGPRPRQQTPPSGSP